MPPIPLYYHVGHMRKVVTMRIKLREIAGSTILAGAPNGRRALNALLEAAEIEPSTPEPVFLDFTGIEVATASYLRQSILAFRDIIRGRRSNLYPVITNAPNEVRDELEELLRRDGDVLMTCVLDQRDRVSRPALIGDLDPKQKITFDLVCERGETDASELMRDYGAREGVKQTAWNNRLVSLAALGLIVEITQGRAKRYKPLFEGV
jgi:hypothetical protein